MDPQQEDAFIKELMERARDYGDCYETYCLDDYKKIHDFKMMASNKKDHLTNSMAFAEYLNVVHPSDGEKHGVWKALTSNLITMSTDEVKEKTEEDLMDGVFRCLSICLLLGELTFEETKDGCKIDSKSQKNLEKIIKLLDTTKKDFQSNLTNKIITSLTPPLKMPNSLARTYSCRDALSKQIYANLFDFLVVKLNEKNVAK